MSAEDTMPQGNPSDDDPSYPLHGEMEHSHTMTGPEGDEVDVYHCSRATCRNQELVPQEG